MLLVGPPGSGKGTLGPSLEELLGVPHVSSGQLLRASVEQGDPHGVAARVARGDAVPDRIVAEVVLPHILEGDGFILDGYPRTARQAADLDARLEAAGRPIQLVLELVLADEVCSARLSRRARMESRSDDNPDTVAARLVAYRREAPALLAHYRSLVRRVNASGDVEEVRQRAERALASIPRAAVR